MTDEMTPEQMTGHIAAMRAEPWGERREDYRCAFLAYWFFCVMGSVEDGAEKPEADDFLNHLDHFIDSGSTKPEKKVVSPDEAAKAMKGMF